MTQRRTRPPSRGKPRSRLKDVYISSGCISYGAGYPQVDCTRPERLELMLMLDAIMVGSGEQENSGCASELQVPNRADNR
jgi:hypothetical protein